MKNKAICLLAIFAFASFPFQPLKAAGHDTAESEGSVGQNREIVEQPLPHNRFSTTVFISNASDSVSEREPVLAEDPEVLHDMLRSAFYAKFESRDYISWCSQPGIPKGFQDFPEEKEINKIRAGLARKAMPPDGTRLIVIPFFHDLKINTDGRLDEPEWEQLAAKIMIGRDGARTLLYLISSESELFTGCDAIDERTETGFDQFRFFIHLNTSPFIENERLHVGSNEARGLRQTNLKWRKDPPTDENERWKKFPISDWNIYDLATGTCSFSGNKKYEAAMNLEESGIHPDIPFSSYIEVESDPVYEGKKFKHRVHTGELGTEQQPVWFIIKGLSAEASDSR